MAYLESNQEEADTKLLLHAVDATTLGATSRATKELCGNTSFVTRRGQRRRKVRLSPIVRTLRPDRTAALLRLHAWSGATVTGSFAGKGKLACWKAFLEANENSVKAPLPILNSSLQSLM